MEICHHIGNFWSGTEWKRLGIFALCLRIISNNDLMANKSKTYTICKSHSFSNRSKKWRRWNRPANEHISLEIFSAQLRKLDGKPDRNISIYFMFYLLGVDDRYSKSGMFLVETIRNIDVRHNHYFPWSVFRWKLSYTRIMDSSCIVR